MRLSKLHLPRCRALESEYSHIATSGESRRKSIQTVNLETFKRAPLRDAKDADKRDRSLRSFCTHFSDSFAHTKCLLSLSRIKPTLLSSASITCVTQFVRVLCPKQSTHEFRSVSRCQLHIKRLNQPISLPADGLIKELTVSRIHGFLRASDIFQVFSKQVQIDR